MAVATEHDLKCAGFGAESMAGRRALTEFSEDRRVSELFPLLPA
jgi:hypothetical protein